MGFDIQSLGLLFLGLEMNRGRFLLMILGVSFRSVANCAFDQASFGGCRAQESDHR